MRRRSKRSTGFEAINWKVRFKSGESGEYLWPLNFSFAEILGCSSLAICACRNNSKYRGLLRIPKIPAIIGIPKDKTIEDVKDPKRKRLILLDPTVKADSIESLPTEIKSFALESEAKLISFEIELDYDYWTVEQVLRAILPVELDVPTGFATIGHIAHFNLKKEYQPFKEIIGQVVLDKNPNIRTVVNKTDNIDHTFRFFSMELLAGEDNTMAKMREGITLFEMEVLIK